MISPPAASFMQLCRDYSHHFTVHGKDVSGHARHYLTELLGTERRKNIEHIESDVADSNYQGMQQFITDSPWSHEALLEQTAAADADGLLGGDRDTALYLDETSFVKKGERSVGVQRQYCGRLGKTENCQVGVFACLGRGRYAALVDFRLFLPESWAQDEARCVRAKIPEDRRERLTKTELALEMVRSARARGSRHQWIGGDEVYGGNPAFCAQLEDLGETFLMDVGAATVVWDADPGFRSLRRAPVDVPAAGRSARRSRPANIRSASSRPRIMIRKTAVFTMRETTQGPLQARLWVREVWLWAQGAPQARRRLLIVRREADGTHKYSLSNAPSDTSWERLGRMQAQRFWIEQAFKEAKSELGMAHYEARGWKGWHHHMALVCLAQLFTVRERLAVLPDIPLLSARDLVELLDHYIPRRPRDEDEVFRQMALRHQRRAQAQVSHAERTGITSKIT